MVEVAKVIIKKGGCILLIKRSAHVPHFQNLWDLPGGRLNPDETLKDAAIRETKEETNLDIEPGDELMIKEYRDNIRERRFHFFKARPLTSEIKLCDEHCEFAWIHPEKIKNLDLHPSVKLYFGL